MSLVLPPPSETQRRFFAERHSRVAFGGARGGGKSWAVRVKAVLLCEKYPGIKVMIVRRTYGELRATGGYGSSYAQSVGQLQFNEYLQRLADILPETYGKALDAWEAEGKELERRYSAATALEQTDYDRYLDELEQYNRTLSNARSDAATAYERMISADKLAYDRAVDDYERRVAADKVAYSRHQDNDSSSSGVVRIVVKKQSSDKDEQSGSTAKKKSASKSAKSKLK